MPKRRVNEPGINYLQQEVQGYRQEVGDLRRELEIVRNDRIMLLDILEDLTSDASYWAEGSESLLFRLKNILNNIKNG